MYSTGINTHGQLGNGYNVHVSDLSKIDNLSNYQIKDSQGQIKQVEVEMLKCGYNHCLAKLNIGAAMIWGAN